MYKFWMSSLVVHIVSTGFIPIFLQYTEGLRFRRQTKSHLNPVREYKTEVMLSFQTNFHFFTYLHIINSGNRVKQDIQKQISG
jgi:hypothetical protein